ncbi:MAG TPA: alkaline phosphatase family protein [Candidatus Angelobacter sp.]
MHSRNAQLALAITIVVFALVCPYGIQAQTTVPHSSHVILVMDENTSYSTTVAQMPWLVQQGQTYGYATNFISDTSGSLMDYLWTMSGSCHSSANCTLPAGTNDFGCSGDSCASPITDANIFRLMNNLGISWKVYAQSYAAAGGTVTTPDNANGTSYYRRHNGVTWYSDILSNVSGSQAKVVDFSQFGTDMAANALPQFSIIVPDGLHDAHDGTPAQADTFLHTNLTPLLAQPYFQSGGDGLLIITFDNGDFDIAGQVYTAVIGPNVTPHTVSNTAYHHENTLRTILDALGITTYPGASGSVTSMTDFFAPSTGSVTITSPLQNATTGTSVLVTASATESTAQIYQLQVWDDTTGVKLGESAPNTSTISQTYTLTAGTHRIIVLDISTVSYSELHSASVNITVSNSLPTDGVTITSPINNSTTGTQVLVTASAVESSAQIYQLQVWDDTLGVKLGESAPNTSTISQTYTLAPGTHRIIVEDISTGTFSDLHTASVTINVASSAQDGVTITSPLNNSTTGSQVLVTASARESSAQIYQLQVWDNTTGKKLGESAPGTSTISQTYTLGRGKHQIIVEDISTGTYQVLHKASVTIKVSF